jgi:cobalt/nickel transport system permease protein
VHLQGAPVSPWAGVDETVVARVAAEAGRTPSKGESGDLLLFAFLCAGIVGGFALGYFYRVLFVEGRRAR